MALYMVVENFRNGDGATGLPPFSGSWTLGAGRPFVHLQLGDGEPGLLLSGDGNRRPALFLISGSSTGATLLISKCTRS